MGCFLAALLAGYRPKMSPTPEENTTARITTGSDIFYVLALCVEIDSIPYAPECANPLQASGSEENLRNQLLVRNRQVYLDSATDQIHSGKQMI